MRTRSLVPVLILAFILVTMTAFAQQITKVQKSNGIIINPSTDESISALISAMENSTIHTSGTVTASVSNETLTTRQIPGTTGGAVAVAVSTSPVTCLSANSNHRGRVIHNETSATLYYSLGSTVSSTLHTDIIQPTASIYISPSEYGGIITCAISSGTGTALVTEITQ